LIDPDSADDFRSVHAGIGVRSGAIGADRAGDAEIVDGRAIPDGRVIETDRSRYAVAELEGVLDVVDAGVGILTAEQGRVDVARETVPGRRISRRRLTEGEAGELDEEIFDRDIAVARGVKQLRVVAEVGREGVGVERAAAQRGELKITLAEGANHTVLGRGAGIDRQRHTRTGN